MSEMQTVVAEIRKLQEEISRMKLELAEARSGTGQRGEPAEVDEADVDEGSVREPDSGHALGWEEVLGPSVQTVRTPQAKAFAELLEHPPPISQLLSATKTVPTYHGALRTPPPRKVKVDRDIATTQRKLETALNAMTHHLETSDPHSLGLAGALVRSSWEDLQQNRRRIMAGRAQFALKPREDNDQPRLLDKDEEDKVRRARQPRPQGKGKGYFAPSGQSQGQGSSHSKGFGKGFGRGRPRSQSRGPRGGEANSSQQQF
jgi:hypothetical protein